MIPIKFSRLFLSLVLVAFFNLQPAAQVSAQDEAPQIRITQVDNSQFPQVTVYISVTNAAGEPVTVDPSTLQVYENGVLMTPTQVSGSGQVGSLQTSLTTMLVMDVSGSMEKSNKLNLAKEAAKTYIDQMRPGDQAGLMSFNTEVVYNQTPTSDKAALINAIDSLQADKDTAMYDALLQTIQNLDVVSGRKAVIVLTDGLDNRSQANEDIVIDAIGPSGLSISTIGLGNPEEGITNYGLDEPGLKSLAERAGGGYGFAATGEVLNALYQQQGRTLQSEYMLVYTSPSALRDGVNRTLSVSLVEGDTSFEAVYNPGGVLPEVPNRSWALFGGILAGLVILFAIPFLVRGGVQALGGSKPKSRIKLQKPSGSSKKVQIKLK
jgi:Ca-activated chloride channel homolog